MMKLSPRILLQLLLSLVSAAAPAKDRPPSTPRLLVKLVGGAGPDQVRATVENLAEVPVAIDIVPAFTLRPAPTEAASRPAFRAPIDLGTARPLAVNGSARLQLAPKERQTIVVPLESLYWDHSQSALWPFRPLRRVVLPGRYDLILEFVDPASGYWWRSNLIPAVVRKAGTLELQKPD
jgi:hypothetical protein